MTPFTCQACHRTISSDAELCPHCGVSPPEVGLEDGVDLVTWAAVRLQAGRTEQSVSAGLQRHHGLDDDGAASVTRRAAASLNQAHCNRRSRGVLELGSRGKIGLWILAAVVFLWCTGNEPGPSAAYETCKDLVRQRLGSRAADFPAFRSVRTQTNERLADAGIFQFTSHVDVSRAEGNRVRRRYVCRVQAVDEGWRLQQLEIW